MGNQKQSVCPLQAPNEQLSLEKHQQRTGMKLLPAEAHGRPVRTRFDAWDRGEFQDRCLGSWTVPGLMADVIGTL